MFIYFHRTVVASLLITFTGCINVHSDAEKLPESINLPEIQEARKTGVKLQRDARELNEIGNQLYTTTTNISCQQIALSSDSPDAVIENLIATTQALRESAKTILEKAPQFIQKVDEIFGPLGTAPQSFTNVAKLFRSFAAEEPYADIAEDYRQVATLFDNMAIQTQEGTKKLQQNYNRDALLETLKYIRHQERFLDRFESVLRLKQAGLWGKEPFHEEIETYIKKYEQFRAQIRGLNEAFRNLDNQLKPLQQEKPGSRETPPNKDAQVAAVDRAFKPQERHEPRSVSVIPVFAKLERAMEPSTSSDIPWQPF
jgi:hypothetical protein